MNPSITIPIVVSLVLSLLGPSQVSPQSSQKNSRNIQNIGLADEITATPSATSEWPYPPPESSTATPIPTETPTLAPTLESTQTPTPQPTSTQEPQPRPTEEVPSGKQPFELSTKKASFLPGDTVALSWSTVYKAKGKAQKIRIQMPADWNLPDQPQAQIHPLPIDQDSKGKGKVEASYFTNDITGTIRFQTSTVSEDTMITVEFWDDEAFIGSQDLYLLAVSTKTVDKHGDIVDGKASGMKVRLTVDPSALEESADISIQTPENMPGTLPNLGTKPIQLKAVGKKNGNTIHQFNGWVTVEVEYDPSLIDIDPSVLTLFWYDESIALWRPLPSAVDADNHILKARTDHFSLFALGKNGFNDHVIPPLDAAQVSEFTGSASYSISIEVPSGSGGIKPSVSLDYNSMSVEGITNDTQVSWVGAGWTLSAGGMISRNLGKDQRVVTDDTFSLSVGGMAMQLVPFASGNISGTDYIDYKSSSENFWLIRRYKISSSSYFDDQSGAACQPSPTYTACKNYPMEMDKWVVWDTAGTRYTFDTRAFYPEEVHAVSGQTGMNCASGNYFCSYRPWGWFLTETMLPSGKAITYAWNTFGDKDLKCINGIDGSSWCADQVWVDHAMYPEVISYPDNKTKVIFIPEAGTRPDFMADWGWSASGLTRYEKKRLSSVQVKLDATIVREYVLEYFSADDLVNIPIFPESKWYPVSNNTQIKKALSVLKKVTEYGVGGLAGASSVNTLPAISFTYGEFAPDPAQPNSKLNIGDKYHLSQIDNGQGGKVIFTYEANNYNEMDDDPRTPFTASNGSQKTVDQYHGSPMYLNSEAIITYDGSWNTPSGLSVRPGMGYKLDCYASAGSTATKVRFEIDYADSGGSSYYSKSVNVPANGGTVSAVITIPGNATRVTPAIRPEGTPYATISNCHGAPVLTHYRVTQRIVKDSVTGQPYSFSYDYRNPTTLVDSAAVNDAQTSAVVNSAQQSVDQWNAAHPSNTASLFDLLTAKPNAEFRGHAWVSVTAPDGSITRTNFYQDDLYYGRIHQVKRYENGKLLSLSSNDWASQALTGIPTTSLCAKEAVTGYCFPDQKVNWIYSSWDETRDYGSGVTDENSLNFTGFRKEYKYADRAGFGNLVGVIERTWNSSQWVSNRLTRTSYSSSANDSALTATGKRTPLSLPASSNLYTCTQDDCNFTSSGSPLVWSYPPMENLVASTCFLYETPTDATGGTAVCSIQKNGATISETLDPPNSGLLTGKRVLLSFTNGNFADPRYSDEITVYDAWGNRVQTSVYRNEGTATSRADKQSSPLPVTTTWQYDGVFNSRVTSVDNPLQPPTTYTYGDTTSNSYILGLPYTETDPNNAVAYATYDAFGRFAMVILPGDNSNAPTINLTYSPLGEIPAWVSVSRKTTGGQTAVTRSIFNGLGQVVQTQQATQVLATSTSDVVVDTSYDFAGRVVKQTTPVDIALFDGSTALYRPQINVAGTPYTQTTYDSLGRTESVTAPDNTTTTYLYGYDSQTGWRTISVTDPRGNPTTTYMDALGLTRKVVPPTGPGTTYSYNVAGKLTSATYGSATTTLSYDLAGRKTGMVDADMGSWLYAYDAAGNLTRQRDALQPAQVSCLYYDALNRLIGKNYQGDTACPASPATYTVGYTYDQTGVANSGIGRRTAMNDRSGSTQWEYDLRGRLIHEAKTVIDPQGSLGMGTYHSYWSYNPDDSVRQMVLPNMETVNFAYTPQGSLRQVYSILNGATADVTQQYIRDMTYTAAGQVKVRVLGNGTTQSYGYYDWTVQGGRLQNLNTVTAGSPGQIRQNLTYTYDPNGNIQTISDTVANENLTFEYDALNRLDLASGAYGENPTYDPASGNILNRITGIAPNTTQINYGYTDPLHPHAVNQLNGVEKYTYDKNGNMKTRVYQNVTYTLTYDAENHLTNVTGGSLNARYIYDGDGNRVLTEVNGTRTVYIGDTFEAQTSGTSMSAPTLTNYAMCHDRTRCGIVFLPIVMGPESTPPTPIGMTSGNFGITYYHTHQQTPANGVTWRVNYSGQAVLRVKTSSSDILYYILTDHLGGTSKTITENGSLFGELRYSAWGETRYTYGNTPTQRRYTGQLESEAGLYFYKSRFYDSALGRFSQPDTVVPLASQGVMAHDRYAAMNNNPVRYSDPSGHCIICLVVGVVALVAVGGYEGAVSLGMIPDYVGIARAEAAMSQGGGSIEVAAGLAVQGEFSGYVDDFVGDLTPGSSGYGIAQTNSDEISALGLGNLNPQNPTDAVKVMQARIVNAQGACNGCTAKDKVVVAALAQNGGISISDIQDLSGAANGGGINWQEYFDRPSTSKGQIDAQIRQKLVGMNYNKNFMLHKYIMNLRELYRRGWDLPDGITSADLNQLEKLAKGE